VDIMLGVVFQRTYDLRDAQNVAGLSVRLAELVKFVKTSIVLAFQTSFLKARHFSLRSVSVFLKERQALKPHTGPGTWGGPSSNIRVRESGISRSQALRVDLNRFAIDELGSCTASAQRETAGVATPFR
jgi:hypothetical protein